MGIDYIIWDRVTDQKLAYYDSKKPHRWVWDCDYYEVSDRAEPLMTKVQIFNTKVEAEAAINHIETVFRANGETEISFEIQQVRLIKGYQLVE
jgi:hypothetical protein